MKAWRTCLLVLALSCGLNAQSIAQGEAIRIGIIPYLSPGVLMSLFQPLRLQLQKDIGRPIELFTAPDVRSFAQRTLKPDFDIIITAPHQARLAQQENSYIPIAQFTGPLHAAVIVSRDSSLKKLEDLRGKRLSMTDRSILVNIVMTKIFSDLGLGDKDFDFHPANSQNTAMLSVAQGDSDAAVIAHFTLDQSPEEQRNAVRVIFRSPALPNVTLLASVKLPVSLRDRIRDSLLALPTTTDGAIFLEKSRFVGIRATDEMLMKSLDPYLKETRKQLGL